MYFVVNHFFSTFFPSSNFVLIEFVILGSSYSVLVSVLIILVCRCPHLFLCFWLFISDILSFSISISFGVTIVLSFWI
jgi:hypothetical protein